MDFKKAGKMLLGHNSKSTSKPHGIPIRKIYSEDSGVEAEKKEAGKVSGINIESTEEDLNYTANITTDPEMLADEIIEQLLPETEETDTNGNPEETKQSDSEYFNPISDLLRLYVSKNKKNNNKEPGP